MTTIRKFLNIFVRVLLLSTVLLMSSFPMSVSAAPEKQGPDSAACVAWKILAGSYLYDPSTKNLFLPEAREWESYSSLPWTSRDAAVADLQTAGFTQSERNPGLWAAPAVDPCLLLPTPKMEPVQPVPVPIPDVSPIKVALIIGLALMALVMLIGRHPKAALIPVGGGSACTGALIVSRGY